MLARARLSGAFGMSAHPYSIAAVRARLLARALPLWTERHQLTLWAPIAETVDADADGGELFAPRAIPHYVDAPVDAWLATRREGAA
jgi:hypothetical protein